MSASSPQGADEYKRTRSSEDDDAMDQDSSPEDKKSTSKKGGDLSGYNLDDYDEDDTRGSGQCAPDASVNPNSKIASSFGPFQ